MRCWDDDGCYVIAVTSQLHVPRYRYMTLTVLGWRGPCCSVLAILLGLSELSCWIILAITPLQACYMHDMTVTVWRTSAMHRSCRVIEINQTIENTPGSDLIVKNKNMDQSLQPKTHRRVQSSVTPQALRLVPPIPPTPPTPPVLLPAVYYSKRQPSRVSPFIHAFNLPLMPGAFAFNHSPACVFFGRYIPRRRWCDQESRVEHY